MSVLVIAALAFVCTVLILWQLLAWLQAGEWRTRRRLQVLERKEPTARPGDEAPHAGDVPVLSGLLVRLNLYATLQHQLERAGLAWRPGEALATWGAIAIALAGIGWWLLGPLTAVAAFALTGLGGGAALNILQARRLRQFELQLADALMLMASSLRSGYGVLRSLQAIRDEMKPPIRDEFARVLDEMAVGLDIQQALTRLLQRVPLPDLEIAVTAILIQADIGGSLSEVLETVAETVRERQRIRAEVDTLTAEGRLSGVVLFVLPIAMGVVLVLINPSYMEALFRTTFGQWLVGCAVVLQLIGGIVIKRMLRVDF